MYVLAPTVHAATSFTISNAQSNATTGMHAREGTIFPPFPDYVSTLVLTALPASANFLRAVIAGDLATAASLLRTGLVHIHGSDDDGSCANELCPAAEGPL